MGGELDRAEVRRIARLARLELGREEVERLARELASVLEHFRAIDVAAADHAAAAGKVPVPGRIRERGLAPRLAADSPPSDPLLRDPAALAPEWRDGFFLVPRPTALDEPPP